MKQVQDIKLLFLGSGPAMPSRNTAYRKKFEILSQYFSGDIITHASSEELDLKKIGRFNFIPFHYTRNNPVIRNVRFYLQAIKKALHVIQGNHTRSTIIVSPDPLVTGIAAIIIGKIARKKVVIEVNGCFDQAMINYMQKSKSVSIAIRLKKILTDFIVPFVLKRADRVKLLYPDQLLPLGSRLSRRLDISVFHDFVPVESFIGQNVSDNKYILLLGHPWYLKGVDVLIKAFLKISTEYPEYELIVAGWCPDPVEKQYFMELSGNNPKIHLLDPVKYNGVISYMIQCSMYVLASRTEAMGRVLIEAMASRKPILASDVGGVPYIIHDGYNGLLFENESVDDLAEKIQRLLSNPGLADTLAANGYTFCQTDLSEKQYATHYLHMIMSLLEKHNDKATGAGTE